MACSGSNDGKARQGRAGADGRMEADASAVPGTGGSPESPPTILHLDASSAASPHIDARATSCVETASGETTLEPVHLAFAFDVSGSMGKLDFPYHDPKLKWEPVVAATKAFFIDSASANMFASLVFFPIDAGESKRCSASSYGKPDVPVTPLPSDAFGRAIDAIAPKSTGDWRGGTPTLAVIEGTIDFITPLAKADPGVRYAIVLVSDGYPQGCSDNKISSVVSRVSAVSSKIPTYVIGVANPPGGPDTVSNLNDIAVAGATQKAFIIQTGDPQQTAADFEAAVRAIRSASVSCEFQIPSPPPGQMFDPSRANVTYASGGAEQKLDYDGACASDRAWRYDDPSAPSRMVLCDTTCTAVQADPGATLRVEFGCTRRDVIR